MNTLIKREIKNIAFGFGCTSMYSGKNKEMYIYGDNFVECLKHIQSQKFDLKGVIITGKKKK